MTGFEKRTPGVEVTALLTEPKPLPKSCVCVQKYSENKKYNSVTKKTSRTPNQNLFNETSDLIEIFVQCSAIKLNYGDFILLFLTVAGICNED